MRNLAFVFSVTLVVHVGAVPWIGKSNCHDISGSWIGPDASGNSTTYTLKRTGPSAYAATAPNVPWEYASVRVHNPPTTVSVDYHYTNGAVDSYPDGLLDASCTVLGLSAGNGCCNGSHTLWCSASNPSCAAAPPDPFWSGGEVLLVESAHSDVFWLGSQDDMLIDSGHIALALDLMAKDPNFKWAHECVLFLRAFLGFYPDREAELVRRMREGRMDMGATWTEPFESVLYNEVLVRQMYMGRKWFIERYPDLADTHAIVAYHQDGPCRALQMPQIYAKAGVKYLKFSRYSDNIFRWRSPDGSSLLAFGEVHYGEAGLNVRDTYMALNLWLDKYKDAGLPNIFPLNYGIDYTPPSLRQAFIDEWNNASADVGGPKMRYSNYVEMFSLLDRDNTHVKTVEGERPNLWWPEWAPTHHRMNGNFRHAARLLPAAETFASVVAMATGSWSRYPTEGLGEAWMNVTVDDHGLGHETTPEYPETPANTSMNGSLPWLLTPHSPPFADQVYQDKWRHVVSKGEALLADSQSWLAARVVNGADEGSDDDDVVVFNSLSWERGGEVEVEGYEGGTVIDVATGAVVPSQTTVHGTLLFAAPPVPGFGHRHFKIKPHTTTVPHQVDETKLDDGILEVGMEWTSPISNAFFRVSPGVGGVASVVDLASGQELFNTSTLAAGEWMALAYTDNGASETRTYRAPHADWNASSPTRFQRLSEFAWSGWVVEEHGHVRTVLRSRPIDTAHSNVSVGVVLHAQSRRLEFQLSLIGWDGQDGVANRMVFPFTPSATPQITYSVPFGRVRVGLDEAEDGDMDTWMTQPGPEVPKAQRGWEMRPREVTDWWHTDVGKIGVTTSSCVGMFDWVDPTGNSTSPVLSPELLMHTISNQGPFTPELGDHHFSFSLFPTSHGGWREGWRDAVQANDPLVARTPPPKPPHTTDNDNTESLPPVGSLITLAPTADADTTDGLWVTAVKKEDSGRGDGLILRLFDQHGSASTATIRFGRNVTSAHGTDIIEHGSTPLDRVTATSVDVKVGAFAIETLRVQLELEK